MSNHLVISFLPQFGTVGLSSRLFLVGSFFGVPSSKRYLIRSSSRCRLSLRKKDIDENFRPQSPHPSKNTIAYSCLRERFLPNRPGKILINFIYELNGDKKIYTNVSGIREKIPISAKEILQSKTFLVSYR